MPENASARYYWILFFLAAVLVALPMFHKGVIVSQGNDIANHTRDIHEYRLALVAHQFPPLVAPTLNGGLRVPLFQFYTGTAYVVPTLINLVISHEYSAFKLAIICLSFFTTLGLYKALTLILKNDRAAFVGALTFQLFSFAMVDLYDRGGFVEWVSQQYTAIVFFSCIYLVHCLLFQVTFTKVYTSAFITIVAMVLFIPCHPVQTLYTGLIIAILMISYIIKNDLPRKTYLFYTLGFIFLISLCLTSWFWVPILIDYKHIKIIKQNAWYAAGTNFINLFWPWYHRIKTVSSPNWAPQLGLPISLSTIALLYYWKNLSGFTKTTLVLFLALVAIILSPSYSDAKVLHLLFASLQWSYRLFVPTALVSALIVGFAQIQLYHHLAKIKAQTIFVFSSLLVLFNFLPLMLLTFIHADYSESLRHIRSPEYFSSNATVSYTLAGTNYADLQWIKNGHLQLNQNHGLPTEGIPFDAQLTLAGHPHVQVFVNTHPIHVLEKFDGTHTIITFTLHPSAGMNSSSQDIQFKSNAAEVKVEDAAFRPDNDTEWVRLPTSYKIESTSASPATAIAIVNKTSFYQLPICYYAGLKIFMNGQSITYNSHDKFLTIVRLQKGVNHIVIQDGPCTIAQYFMWVGIAMLIMFFYGLFATTRATKHSQANSATR